ncbi:MAG: S8 family serine peptidase, partial [Anaerolineae bacterium]|nr:S8 family serine peptidase [Anaerolineae bacterium]
MQGKRILRVALVLFFLATSIFPTLSLAEGPISLRDGQRFPSGSLPVHPIQGHSTKPQAKLDTALDRLATLWQKGTDPQPFALERNLSLRGGRVQVQVRVHPKDMALIRQAIVAQGGQVTGKLQNILQAWVPIGALGSLANLPQVLFIQPPQRAFPLEGNSLTEGLAASSGDGWHKQGWQGDGIKIGVIDIGFGNYPNRVDSGDLPPITPGENARNFVDEESDDQLDDSEPHGTACAEIVHDMAPKAQLYLAKIATDVDLAEAVYWLTNTVGIDIISTSLGWYNAGPGDGTGPLADIVAAARRDGVLWVTAAGNDGCRHWGGDYSPASTDPS